MDFIFPYPTNSYKYYLLKKQGKDFIPNFDHTPQKHGGQDMINPKSRFSAPAGEFSPGGPSTWHILDWDQRRVIAVTVDEEQDTGDLSIEHLKKHVDVLPPDAYAIHLDPDGNLISVSQNPDDDETTSVYYPPLDKLQPPTGIETIARSDLKEVGRLAPSVDLVSYFDAKSSSTRKVVFKYYFLLQYLHRMWNEMNLWIRLFQHPNLVPFDRLVVDELKGNVIGFTSKYIPGGTVEGNPSRVFKLNWLKQLTQVVDDLNLKHGIMHQDIAPRNLLVDSLTDKILLFDFDFMGRIGDVGYFIERDDVKGVIFTLYEIITLDTHYRSLPYDQQDPADVQGLDEWPQHPNVRLDRPVSDYRSVSNDWVNQRREGRQVLIYTEAREPIDWPHLGEPPKKTFVLSVEGNTTTLVAGSWCNLRRNERKKGKAVLDWQRPCRRTE